MDSVIECSVMCRACMKVDGVLLPMYGDDMISKKNLPDKLADLASIHIDKHDGLPTVLCAKCAYRTDAFHDFKLQVQATEKKLRKMFQCSNSQNVAPKAEAVGEVWKSDEYFNEEDSSRSEFRSAASMERSCHSTRARGKKKMEADVKPGLEDGRLTVEARIVDSDERCDEAETTNFADVQMEDNAELSDLQSFNHIFISDIHDMTDEERSDLRDVKREAANGIDDIHQSETMGYALLYIPAEEGTDVDAPETSQMIHPEDRSKTRCIEKSPFEDEEPDEMDRSSEMVSWNGEAATGKWTTDLSYDIIENDDDDESAERKFTNERSNVRETTANDGDSDSDYFVDPQNNILGSLNDTIMRIKEIKSDTDETNYQCTLCMEIYDKLTGVLIHTVDNHVPTSGPFYCVVCEKDCESHRDLRSHVKTHSGRFPYTCFICNKAYSMKRYLKRHMSCHTDFPRHRCPKCGERFNVKTELENHVRSHVHGGPPFACSQCPRVFNHKGNYKRHLISHLDPHGLHLPKYPCQICGKRFLNNRTLQTHIRVHTGEKPFQCDICSRSFSQQGNLLNHLRIHSNPRSYTCEVCGKRFNQRATLRDHSLLHTGEKPYVCNVCGVAFTFSAALRRHMWTHATDKPFGCEICNARFVGKYDIKRHMKTHTDRPKTKRRRNQSRNDRIGSETLRNEISLESQISDDGQTIFIEHQVLLAQDSGQSVQQEEAEKENVDALFNLIQYG